MLDAEAVDMNMTQPSFTTSAQSMRERERLTLLTVFLRAMGKDVS